jgi:branched-chain amino acid aminotransferase
MVYFYEGQWFDEKPLIIAPTDHAMWLAASVFDATRAFRGLAPDLDRHCQRLVESAVTLNMKPTMEAGEIVEICHQGVKRMENPEGDIFIKPMFFATEGVGYGGVVPDPDSTKFVLAVTELAMPDPVAFSACFSSYRRPGRDQAPTTAKTGALYPNVARAMIEASNKGFDNCIVLDSNANVAEFAAANLWMVKDGVAMTPMLNGTFLAGVTRRRVIELLRADGMEVLETTLTPDDVRNADEVFSSGNYGKVMPTGRIEDRDLQPGPVARRARELYFEFAETTGRIV